MDSAPLSGQLPWRAPHDQESFWELHRRLGECYEAELRARHGLSSEGLPFKKFKSSPYSRRSLDPVIVPSLDGASRRGSVCAPVTPVRIKSAPDDLPALSEALPHQINSGSAQELLAVVPAAQHGHLAGTPSNVAESPIGEFGEEHSPTAQGFWPRNCWVERSRSHVPRRRSLSAEVTQSLQVVPEKALPCMLSPTGHFRNIWDFFGILLLMADAVVIPLQLAQVNIYSMFPTLLAASQISLLYWCVDIPISFTTGFLDKGSLVQDYRRIGRRYALTWFAPDVAVTVTDLLIWFSGESLADGRSTTRMLRFLRLFRLIRLGKLTRVSAFLRDYFESQVASIQFSLLLVMLGMLLLEHLIACCWYGLGTYDPDARTWLTSSNLRDDSFFKQYTASLRWSFAQLGIGGTQLEAVTETEGVYTILVGVASLISSSTVISSMTSLVSALHRRRMEETHQFGLLRIPGRTKRCKLCVTFPGSASVGRHVAKVGLGKGLWLLLQLPLLLHEGVGNSALRRFLRQNNVPPSLSHRITRFLSYTYYEAQSLSQEQPHILSLLSKSLQAELQFARYQFCLDKQPFLNRILGGALSFQEGHVLQKIAMQGVAIVDAGEDDLVYCFGGEADACYFSLSGSLRYLQKGKPAQDVPTGVWISEMCLWTSWAYTGDVICNSMSRIAALHVDSFCQGISSVADLQRQAHFYAMEYLEALNLQKDATDLWQFQAGPLFCSLLEVGQPLMRLRFLRTLSWTLLLKPRSLPLVCLGEQRDGQ